MRGNLGSRLRLTAAAMLVLAVSLNPLVPGGVNKAIAQASQGNQPSAWQVVEPFYLALNGVTEGVLARGGRFTLRLRCEPGGGGNATTYILSSSADGWYYVSGGGEALGPLPAGEQVLGSDVGPVPQVAGPMGFAGTAVWDDQTYLYLNTVSQGLGVFGKDCIATGTATIITRIR